MSTILEIVAQGVVPAPNNHIVKAEFTYNTGTKLTLEGDSLGDWFGKYISLLQMSYVIEAARARQEQEAAQKEQMPIVRADTVRDFLSNVENKQRGIVVGNKDK